MKRSGLAVKEVEILLKTCREVARRNNNLGEKYHWVKSPGDLYGGYHYCMVKGRKAHFISFQNGELYPSDFRRSRIGFWAGSIGHIFQFRATLGGKPLSDQFEQYVRGLGYVYRRYANGERLDYVVYDKGLLSIWFLTEKQQNLELEIGVKHSQAWPSLLSADAEAISGEPNYFVAKSRIGETQFRIATDGLTALSFDGGLVSIKITGFTYANLTISERGLEEEPGDLDRTLDFHNSVNENYVLETPDPRIDKLFLWAKHDLLEFFSETPIGNGWYAGFPVFSWFFGRDGLWTGLAANMCGMGEYTRAHMETLLRHSENGRIPHEIGLGTGNGQQYNVSDSMVDTKFMSIDSNLLWLLCNFSLRYYGYDSFPSAVVERVYEFSKGCDENNDLLLENSFSKGLIGWPETWAKYRDGACVDINALWIEVLRNYGISKEYYESSRKKYLDTFFNGTIFVDSVNNGAKKVVKSSTLLVPAMFLDEESVRKTLLRLNDNAILTAWGVRSVASDDPMFDGGYHTGMVWPLMTGWFVFASYRQKMKESGFNQLLTFVNLAFASEDPGRINEVYDSSQPNPVGQFAQSWSSGMFIFSLLGGMLGMRISGDPPQNVKEVFDAALPEDWDKVYFKNFKWAGLTYDIEITSNGVHVI